MSDQVGEKRIAQLGSLVFDGQADPDRCSVTVGEAAIVGWFSPHEEVEESLSVWDPKTSL
jgi:hypothetical protein